ncbi:hypothetical protein GCM10028806_33540 [Spirosoma terrae]|uniref:Uncharacterized protein n=1 Tax=Spirosoma terrae TaxID=1968276 RepID=A0A6L9LG82_9BACT|nr:hypothetical protein [Spirosoma terrae]NDU95669.1 hypothetical protein [Spirosoma terrae]
MNQIIIEVQGGIVHQVLGIPEDTQVLVKDYDIMDINGLDLQQDKNGVYTENTWIPGDVMQF